jgi:dipeptidase
LAFHFKYFIISVINSLAKKNKESMKKPRRITPYKQKARGNKEKEEKGVAIQLLVDKANVRERLELMTKEELERVQKTAAQNALKLFNQLLEEMQKRIPAMTDEVLATSLLSVWARVGGDKK